MRITTILISIFTLILVSGCSSSDKEAAPKAAEKATVAAAVAVNPDVITCTNKKDVRSIEVKMRDDKKGCDVLYTKNKETKTAAGSKHGKSHCEKTANQMKGNLVTAGFTCK